MNDAAATLLPTLGAAMPARMLERYRDWLIDGQRDLEIQDFFKAEVLNGDWKPLAADIRKQLSGHEGRLGIHGPFWGFTIDTMDPDVRDVVKKRMMQGLDACEEIGATQMVVHSPFTTWDYNNFDNKSGSMEDAIGRVHATLGEAVKRAEAIGVTLVIENIEDIDPRWRVRLAESFESERVRVSIDTGHAHYAHGSTGAPPVDYYVVAAGNMLEHVHLQDADGYADRHWVMGEGTIRWASVFRALSQLTSNPRLILELRDHTRIFEAADYLVKAGLAR
ncbi:sugar phosphate isomerase/epimerase family protein [Nisaea nitritireducens]|uniref:sugar phosphate isomerase/epimerase family protein n=1 Tax=Nisaea nitritireducens TaxID=568392 RepID=UPI001868C8E6|nr:sugar phosphate isomerase/epimerase family protein [Nisaea nitritireducens]